MGRVMEYTEFLQRKQIVDAPSGFNPDSVDSFLFDFQADITKWAIRRGRAAIFADCGLGKTPMQLEWAKNITEHTCGKVLIVAPLAVSGQTINEGKKFDIEVKRFGQDSAIQIINYEQMHKIDPDDYVGIVLDESSILKSFTGKYRTELIGMFQNTPYRLACTATPSPNDYMEIGNHAEFLGVMSRTEMLSMFFINDAGDTGTWRLKGHAESEFWKFVCSWAVMIRKPSDLGYFDNGFTLPDLKIIPHVIKSNRPLNGSLFLFAAKTLSERREARKQSMQERCKVAADLVNNSDETWLIWCDLNAESETLTKMIDGAVEVKGADSPEHKEKSMLDFSAGKIKCLVTKPKIAGFGMNWQICHNMAFVGLSDSYEAYYQALRRCYRFGQEHEVSAHIITSELEGNVVANINRKEKDAMKMAANMVEHMSEISRENIKGTARASSEYITDKASGPGWNLYLGDAIELIKNIPDNSIHYSIFSPPFASLFTYSNSTRDMGNCADLDEFVVHFKFLAADLFRVIKQGRLLSFHCMNLPSTITHDGVIGMKDFRGDLIRIFEAVGFIYHSEVCIWKDPLVQATRTKTLTLAHKQISKDSAMCAQGYPDYIVTMRKPGKNLEPIAHGRRFETYAGDMPEPTERKQNDPRVNKYSHKVWQRYASPVWFDIRQTYTLNSIKSEKDEKHICPLQLDTIERCLEMWSNKGDTVLSPFAGIGSEGYQSLIMERHFIGFELKPEYFHVAVSNMKKALLNKTQLNLFEVADAKN